MKYQKTTMTCKKKKKFKFKVIIISIDIYYDIFNNELVFVKAAVRWNLKSSSVPCARSLVLLKKEAIVLYAGFEQQLICYLRSGEMGGIIEEKTQSLV